MVEVLFETLRAVSIESALACLVKTNHCRDPRDRPEHLNLDRLEIEKATERRLSRSWRVYS